MRRLETGGFELHPPRCVILAISVRPTLRCIVCGVQKFGLNFAQIMMKSLRAFLSLLLVAIATVLVGCGGPKLEAPPVYTPEKIADLQLYLTPLNQARDRMSELGDYVDQKDWNNVKSLIHGPFGSMRSTAGYINRTLLKRDQPQAIQLSEDLFADLERLDAAARDNNAIAADVAYDQAVQDFDAYLEVIPTKPDTAA